MNWDMRTPCRTLSHHLRHVASVHQDGTRQPIAPKQEDASSSGAWSSSEDEGEQQAPVHTTSRGRFHVQIKPQVPYHT